MRSEVFTTSVFVFVISMIVLLVLTVVLGSIVDEFLFISSTIETQDNPRFPLTEDGPLMSLIGLIFKVPYVFAVLLCVWLFKLLIREHSYTREDYE